MSYELLCALQQWVADYSSRRSVHIEIGDPQNRDYFKIFVYDYVLAEGKHVTTIEELNELDLKKIRKERMMAEYNKLMDEELTNG